MSSMATFFINFHYVENTNIPNDFTIFIQPNNVQETSLTSSLANSLVSEYFNQSADIKSCTRKSAMNACESFKAIGNAKVGLGVAFGQDKGNFMPIVFSCSVFKESKDYINQKSCIDF